ncbi:MAG: hypothetical protein CMO80_22105 [Verrucomicrobiales bacterium]|nr:hypothetical protein [Verrucomicrobiales bacterium]|tara:strand:+ start:20419 stop:20658 length:240 start_codon:yes stop_codon:yes gene_type:complete
MSEVRGSIFMNSKGEFAVLSTCESLGPEPKLNVQFVTDINQASVIKRVTRNMRAKLKGCVRLVAVEKRSVEIVTEKVDI